MTDTLKTAKIKWNEFLQVYLGLGLITACLLYTSDAADE